MPPLLKMSKVLKGLITVPPLLKMSKVLKVLIYIPPLLKMSKVLNGKLSQLRTDSSHRVYYFLVKIGAYKHFFLRLFGRFSPLGIIWSSIEEPH